MGKIKWTFYIVITLIIVAFFHYSLPSRDVVRIVGTDTRIIGTGTSSWFWASEDAGTTATETRDIRFISAVYENGDPRVYRNEDTAWSWPPYLKFDSSNLDAVAKDFAQKQDTWVAVHHYGWRLELLSMFPNAYKIKQVDGPNVQLIPWFNIIFLTILGLIAFAIYRRISRWKNRNVDPVLEDAGEFYNEVTDVLEEGAGAAKSKATAAQGRFSRWLDTWKSKPNRKG